MRAPWPTWALAASALISASLCGASAAFGKRQSAEGIVGGLESRDENGNPFIRREVRDLQSDYPDQWALYLLALDQMHGAAQEDPASYYGVAKIHGRPYKTVLDAPGIAHKIGTTGYCPHSMALFLGWHRPYLALFEQAVYARIQILASYAPDDQRERFRWAAHSFRIPYWDWALGDGGGGVPELFTSETVVVGTPEGRDVEIWNPLYRYTFQPIPDGFEDKMNHTVRWPASESPWADSRQYQFVASFARLRRQMQDQVAVAFRRTSVAGFGEAIEQVHGWVHGAIGGGYAAGTGGRGHMWPLEYSSYEPLFWLHHANVDRLFALWQLRNPDAVLQRTSVGGAGNVFVEDHATVDGDTPLLPFRRNPGSFWTTNEAMDWRLFGYDYPETRAGRGASADAVVAQMYSGSVRERLAAGQTGGAAHPPLAGADGAEYTDWVVSAAAAPLGLPRTFVVQFSLVADFSSDASTDVGMWSVMLPAGNDEKRAPDGEMTLHGALSLTSSLLDQIDAGTLSTLDAKHVVPFLKEKLSWKLYGADGTQLPDASLDSLRIDVASETARIPADPSAPIAYGNATTAHPEVTAGKRGGSS